jgi:hypothetical protein
MLPSIQPRAKSEQKRKDETANKHEPARITFGFLIRADERLFAVSNVGRFLLKAKAKAHLSQPFPRQREAVSRRELSQMFG